MRINPTEMFRAGTSYLPQLPKTTQLFRDHVLSPLRSAASAHPLVGRVAVAAAGLLAIASIAVLAFEASQYIEERSFPTDLNTITDQQRAIKEVSENGRKLKKLSLEMRNNPAVVTAAAEQNGIALVYAGEDLIKDKDFVRDLVIKGTCSLYAARELRKNKDFVLSIVKDKPEALQDADNTLQNDLKFALQAIHTNPKAFKFLNFRMTLQVVILTSFPSLIRMWQIPDTEILAAVGQDGWALEFASPEMKNNEEVVLAAVQKDGWALEFASPEMKNNEKVVLAAVQQNGMALRFASQEMKDNETVVLAAVEQDTMALYYGGQKTRDNNTIILTAVSRNSDRIRYASERLQNLSKGKTMEEFELALRAQEDPQPPHEELPQNTPFQEALNKAKNNPTTLRNVGEDLQENIEFWTAVLEQNYNHFIFLPKNIQENRGIVATWQELKTQANEKR